MISVIIPTYNRARYIKECLESVFNQTYKDFEIILVDDGSTDNLKEVIEPYMSKIRYIYKENGGVASARNAGLRNANGEYIAWLDSDDKWLPFKLELQVKILEKLPNAGFIYSDFSCFTDKKGKIADSYLKEYFFTYRTYDLNFEKIFSQKTTLQQLGVKLDNIDSKVKVYCGNLSKVILLGPLFPTPTVINRKECIAKIGLLDETFQTGDEYDFQARVAQEYNAAFVDLPTAECRRFHSDQLSSEKMEIITNLALLKVVERLGIHNADFYIKNKRFVNQRLSHCYYGIGTAFYKKALYREALNNFSRSLKINLKQKKIYIYTFISALRLFFKEKEIIFNKFVQLSKGVLIDCAYYSGIIFQIEKNISKVSQIKILTLHRITDAYFDPLCMNIKVNVFEEMVKYLKRNYNIISLEKAVDLLKSKESVPENAVVMTFDDGYRDNYLNAFPVLRKYEIPATIFLSVGAVNNGGILWYDAIVAAFKKTNKTYVDLRHLNLGIYPLASRSDKLRAVKEVTMSGKRLKTNERDTLVKNILKELGTHPENKINPRIMLTWDEIKIMKNAGIYFGSHGMSHSILSMLSSEEVEFEIAASKQLIKEKTGIDVSFFSYPNGEADDFNEGTIELLKKRGYLAACSLIKGANKNTSLFALRRYCVTHGMVSNIFGNFSKSLFEVKTTLMTDANA